MIAFCHKFWPVEEYHQQWIGLIDKTKYRVLEWPATSLFCLHTPNLTCIATDGCCDGVRCLQLSAANETACSLRNKLVGATPSESLC